MSSPNQIPLAALQYRNRKLALELKQQNKKLTLKLNKIKRILKRIHNKVASMTMGRLRRKMKKVILMVMRTMTMATITPRIFSRRSEIINPNSTCISIKSCVSQVKNKTKKNKKWKKKAHHQRFASHFITTLHYIHEHHPTNAAITDPELNYRILHELYNLHIIQNMLVKQPPPLGSKFPFLFVYTYFLFHYSGRFTPSIYQISSFEIRFLLKEGPYH
jgi:hypothetical protein